MAKLFGTDGVRGIANSELTPSLAYNLGKAGAYVLGKRSTRPVVLIGKDTRISGDLLEDSLSAGILAMGADVIKVGVLPTPAIAFLIKHFNADAGVVISASHNPYEYNGIKFFNQDGFKLDDDIEDEIENLISARIDLNSHVVGDKLGKCLKAETDAINYYGEFLKSTIDCSLEGLKIVIDCANGAAYQIAEKVFRDLKADVTVLFNEPNGININDHCGSTYPDTLQKKVLELNADIGLAFDGDADRLIAVDEKGRTVDGDKLIYICARMLHQENKLVGNKITVTVMSNMGFHKAVEKLGCKVETTQVGDRYVLESMLKTGGIIGGEQSGHIIFLEHTTTGDGILSALQVLRAFKASGKLFSELADEVTIYPQVLKNAKIKNTNKNKYLEDPEVKNKIENLEKKMAGEGRVLIRPSGTEPLVRVMLEGKNQEEINSMALELAELIEKNLG